MSKCFVCRDQTDVDIWWFDDRKADLKFPLCCRCNEQYTTKELDEFVAPLYEETTKLKVNAIDPDYYKWHPISECNKIIQEFPANLAMSIKYLWRNASPDNRKNESFEGQIEDLRKAIKFIEYEIARVQAKQHK